MNDRRTKRARPRAAADLGEELWERLEAAEGKRLPTEDLRGKMTRSQFERGKAWIRDKKCALEHRAFVLFEGWYHTTTDPTLCAAAIIREFRVIERRVRRIHSAMIEPLPAEAQANAAIGLLKSQCLTIMSAMQVLEEAGYSADAAVKLAAVDGSGRSRNRKRTSE